MILIVTDRHPVYKAGTVSAHCYDVSDLYFGHACSAETGRSLAAGQTASMSKVFPCQLVSEVEICCPLKQPSLCEARSNFEVAERFSSHPQPVKTKFKLLRELKFVLPKHQHSMIRFQFSCNELIRKLISTLIISRMSHYAMSEHYIHIIGIKKFIKMQKVYLCQYCKVFEISNTIVV